MTHLDDYGGSEAGKRDTMGDEREVQHEPQVLEGEDDLPRQPAPPLDPYTPEPGPRPGEGRAFRVMWLAFIPILIAVAVVLWGALR